MINIRGCFVVHNIETETDTSHFTLKSISDSYGSSAIGYKPYLWYLKRNLKFGLNSLYSTPVNSRTIEVAKKRSTISVFSLFVRLFPFCLYRKSFDYLSFDYLRDFLFNDNLGFNTSSSYLRFSI